MLSMGWNVQPSETPSVTLTLAIGMYSAMMGCIVIVAVTVLTSDGYPTSTDVVYGGSGLVVVDEEAIHAGTVDVDVPGANDA